VFGPPDIDKLRQKRRVGRLIKALSYRKDEGVRERAARALGEVADARAVIPLLQAVTDTSNQVRVAAIWALGEIRDPQPVEALIALLEAEAGELSRASAIALGKIATPEALKALIERLTSEDEALRSAAQEGLKLAGAQAVPELVSALEEASAEQGVLLAETLSQLGAEAQNALTELSKSQQAKMRALAAQALAHIEPEVAVAALVPLLTDQDTTVRRAASATLISLGNAAAERLTPLLDLEEDTALRRELVQVLGEIGDSSATDAIDNLLDAPDPLTRRLAAQALARIGDRRATMRIATLLRDEDWVTRQAGCDALGEMGDPAAISALTQALLDGRDAVRRSAAKALDRLGWKPDESAEAAAYWAAKRNWRRCATMGPLAIHPLLVAAQDANSAERQSIADLLASIGEETIDPLLEALESESPGTRGCAALALGQLGRREAVQALLALLNDTDGEVRAAAAHALGLLQDPQAVEGLIALFEDSHLPTRDAAVQALACIGTPAIPTLRQAMNSERRALAAQALSSIPDEAATDILVEQIRPDTGEEDPIWQAVVNSGPTAIGPILQRLEEAEEPLAVRFLELTSLLHLDAAPRPLYSWLWDQRSAVRKAAAEAIRKLGEPLPARALSDGKLRGVWAMAFTRDELAESELDKVVISALGEAAYDVPAMLRINVQITGNRALLHTAQCQIVQRKPLDALVEALGSWIESERNLAPDWREKIGPKTLMRESQEPCLVLFYFDVESPQS